MLKDILPHQQVSCVTCSDQKWTRYESATLDGGNEESWRLCVDCKPAVSENKETIRVPSFSNPELSYKVNLQQRSCECKRYEITGTCIKHIVLGQALARVRMRKFNTSSFREMVEGQVFEMCQRIFAGVSRRDALSESADLLDEVQVFRYKTPAMVEAARRRHQKVIAIHEGRNVA